jgi:hypothetical protein
MRKMQLVLLYLAVAAVLSSAFLFIADFSVRQSLALALVLALFALWTDNALPRPRLKFNPYYVTVTPKWFELVTDFKIIAGPNEWQGIQEYCSSLDRTEYSVLRDNIRFTVLQSEDYDRQLLHRSTTPYHGYFSTKIDCEEDMNPLTLETDEHIERMFGKHVPGFFMKSGADGYNLGISVPDRWWDKVKASCPETLNVNQKHTTGMVELTLATIPYSEFDVYWWPTEYDGSFYDSALPRIRSRIDEQRKKCGWGTIKHSEIPELPIHYPDLIEHKYFTVEHRTI